MRMLVFMTFFAATYALFFVIGASFAAVFGI